MSDTKRIKILCLCGAVCVAVLLGILLWLKWEKNVETETATDYEQLVLTVAFPEGNRKIRIWRNEESYFFFLPSGTEQYPVYFGNIGDAGVVRLADKNYKSETSLTKDLQYATPYEMEVTLAGDTWGSVTVQFLKSENIPSIFIDTASGSMDNIHNDKEVKEEAAMVLLGADGGCLYADELEYIKARGNSTFYDFEKKAYQIKLLDKCSLLGMDSAERWILLANVIDYSLMKNELVLNFAEKYTELPAGEGEYVDVYLNGDYAGNYYLCEKVEVEAGRLEITDLETLNKKANNKKDYESPQWYVSEDGMIKAAANLNNPQDITGGYLVECIAEGAFAEATNAFRTEKGNCYAIVSPNPATVEQAEYICNQFNDMETAMAQTDGIHPGTGKHFSEYMDVESWATKYLIDEAFNNPDAKVGGSMFFYKDSDKVNSRIFSGPVWDYDRALGSYGTGGWGLDSADSVGEYGMYVAEMMQHTTVQEAVYDKLENVMVPYVENLLRADVYYLKKQIGASGEMNRVRWPEVHSYYVDYEANNKYQLDFVEQKVNFLKELWLEKEEFCQVTFLNYNGGTLEQYLVKKGDYLKHIPVASSWGGVFAGWYSVETGNMLDARRPVLEDVTYQADWIDLENIVLNWNGGDINAWGELTPDILRYLADWLEELQKTQKTE